MIKCPECSSMHINKNGMKRGKQNHLCVDCGRQFINPQPWNCYFYVTDGWKVYPNFIPEGDQIISKTYMTRVEGENTRLRHYLARLQGKTLCYSKSVEMLKYSISLFDSLF